MKLRKLLSGILATTAVFGCVGTLTACETSNPEARITVSFQGKEYVLDYTMSRKMTPATTSHFIALAEKGYYDGLCVHNYANDKMYTGAYSYDEDVDTNGGLVYKNYYDVVKGYANFPATVFTEDGVPTYTLFGEFTGNNVEWEKGSAPKETYGSLTMYYTDKKDIDISVVLKHPDSEKDFKRSYGKNSATSQFYISLAEQEKTNADYCTFATLDEESVATLDDLKNAVSDYLEDNEDGSDKYSVKVDEDDAYVGNAGHRQTYTVLAEPIIIKSVKITKT